MDFEAIELMGQADEFSGGILITSSDLIYCLESLDGNVNESYDRGCCSDGFHNFNTMIDVAYPIRV